MASVRSRLVRQQIALLNPLLERMGLDAQRALQDSLGALGQSALSESVFFEEEPEIDAVWAIPQNPEPGKAILYLHGGAYTAGSKTYARGFGGILADQAHYSTLCVGYRLAPEHPFPAALDDAVAAYERMLIDHLPQDIAFVGESAGGGLCFCLALRLKQLRLPQPACIVALSPWTDLSMSGKPFEEDPVLRRDNLMDCARMYAGDDLKDPLVSPLFADLSNLPDSLIIAGDQEILTDDSVRMAERLREAGCRCELYIEPDMWHVYPLYPIPEAKKALSRIGQYLSEEASYAI